MWSMVNCLSSTVVGRSHWRHINISLLDVNGRSNEVKFQYWVVCMDEWIRDTPRYMRRCFSVFCFIKCNLIFFTFIVFIIFNCFGLVTVLIKLSMQIERSRLIFYTMFNSFPFITGVLLIQQVNLFNEISNQLNYMSLWFL